MLGAAGGVNPELDVVGELLYDAILLDTTQHLAAVAAAGGDAAAPPGAVHKPRFKKLSRKLLKRLRAFNTSTSYKGLPVRPDSAQLEALSFLALFTRLATFIHARLRAAPGLVVGPAGGAGALRGITCLYLASGRTPFEGAWEAPAATACMVLDSEDPAELVGVGNMFCNSALGARAQIAATLDRIAQGGAELDSLMEAPGQREEAVDAAVAGMRDALGGSVLALLRGFDVEAFGRDSAYAGEEEGAAAPEAAAAEAAEAAATPEEAAAADSAPEPEAAAEAGASDEAEL